MGATAWAHAHAKRRFLKSHGSEQKRQTCLATSQGRRATSNEHQKTRQEEPPAREGQPPARGETIDLIIVGDGGGSGGGI